MATGACGSAGTTTATTSATVPATVDPHQDRVTVPNVSKMTYTEAKQKLQEAGFKVVAPADIHDNSVIASTSPAGGAFVARGAPVEVKIDPTAKPAGSTKAPTTAKKRS